MQKPPAFHEPVRRWFEASFPGPTRAQALGWPPILAGQSTLLLAPTGSGKTLAAFLAAIDRLMFTNPPDKKARCRVLYVSPLKALAVDVERNLRAPLAGIAGAARAGPPRVPTVAVRTGDTPASERAQMLRAPPDILITTPESLYLLLTSQAREILRSVETVIVDEIHSLVPTKRGAHLFLSLERLEALSGRGAAAAHRAVGDAAAARRGRAPARRRNGRPAKRWKARPVTIVDAGSKKPMELRVEVPVEDLAKLGEAVEEGSAQRRSIWPSIHPRLVELVRAHRSTMIFVNSRRLAERLAAALNETAGEEVALAHHGSVARDKRQEIEDRLKRGQLPAIVATSSLELGIDMGAVDLVVQIEAPPSVASGLQRIGRAGHTVGGVPRGVIFPKYRGDLLCSAAAASGAWRRAGRGDVLPAQPARRAGAADRGARRPSVPWNVDDALRPGARRGALRRAAARLVRGRARHALGALPLRRVRRAAAAPHLGPRHGRAAARGRARPRIAVVNGGTIPDRGLYGVFLADRGERAQPARRRARRGDGLRVARGRGVPPRRVVVAHRGDHARPGAGHARRRASPARCPSGTATAPAARSSSACASAALARSWSRAPRPRAESGCASEHGLDERAARNLLAYLREQAEATGEVPSDEAVVVERYVDEIGDWRVCVLSPFGARVHAPWTTAVLCAGCEERGLDDRGASGRTTAWSSASPRPTRRRTRALLSRGRRGRGPRRRSARRHLALRRALPRERGARAAPAAAPPRPAHRRSGRSASGPRDLLAVASRYGSFPILLETYRECLRDVFDLPALVRMLLARRRTGQPARGHRADAHALAVRGVAALLLRRRTSSTTATRRSPSGARRPSSVDPVAAPRAARRGRAARAARRRRDRAADPASLQRLGGHGRRRGADGLHDLLLCSSAISPTRRFAAPLLRRRAAAAASWPRSAAPSRARSAGETPLGRRRGRRAPARRARRP